MLPRILQMAIGILAVGTIACDTSAPSDSTGNGGSGTGGTGGANSTFTMPDAGMGGSLGNVIVEVAGQASNPLPCSSVCATEGRTCVVECKDVGFVFRAAGPVAGWAMYTSMGSGFAINEDRTATSCATAFEPSCGKTFSTKTPWECPPGALSMSGTPYQLNMYKCCCK